MIATARGAGKGMMLARFIVGSVGSVVVCTENLIPKVMVMKSAEDRV